MIGDLPAFAFDRQDEGPDSVFYNVPRLVMHIDDATIAADPLWIVMGRR